MMQQRMLFLGCQSGFRPRIDRVWMQFDESMMARAHQVSVTTTRSDKTSRWTQEPDEDGAKASLGRTEEARQKEWSMMFVFVYIKGIECE